MTEAQQLDFSHEQVATLIRDDLDYLAAVLIPDAATSPFPEFYRIVWAYILQNLHKLGVESTFRFALGLPRGYAKTVFLKLLVCYLIIHDYEISFIAIICATEKLSKNFLADINTMMENPIITQLYGSWEASLEKDTVDDKRARFNGRLVILVSAAVGTSVRGLNIDNKRPHLIICDDAQTKECDNSDTERAALKQWLVGTLFKCLSKTEKKAVLYIGNMYSTECMLYMLSTMHSWTSLITGAILADGKVLWQDIQTLAELMEEYEHDNELGEGATWFAEIQNDPTGASCGLLELGEKLPKCATVEDHTIYPIKFITVDPAGRKATSDDNVVATHALIDGEKGLTLYIANGKWSPTRVIEEIVDQCIEYRVPIVFIEAVAYQETLAFWLEKALAKRNLNVKVIPLPTGTASKYRRIKAWVKQFVGGKWFIADPTSYNKATFQLYKYKADRTDNVDDILDVLAQGILAITKHYQEIIRATPLEEEQQTPKARVMTNNTSLARLRSALR